MADSVSDAPGGAILNVRVIPRASRDRIEGTRGDAVVVRLTAPPLEGAANAAVLEILRRVLGVSRARLEIVGGTRSRDKRVQVSGMTAGEVAAKLEAASGSPTGA
jgi:uncharacterized protein (TIGR00251 family)